MTTQAAVFMTLSVIFVTGLISFCYYRVLTTPPDDE